MCAWQMHVRVTTALLLAVCGFGVCSVSAQPAACGLDLYSTSASNAQLWTTPAVWSPASAQGVVPADAAYIVGGGVVTIDATDVFVDAFNVSRGELVLRNGGTLTVGAPVSACRACASAPCQNGALCTNAGADAFTCACVPGFSGALCQTDVNECASAPCANGATCVDGVGAYNCTCAVGFGGVWCQTNVNDCSSMPCANTGTCVDGIGSYTCACQAGYTGVHCQSEVNECASSPCQNGATCVDLINGFRCALPSCSAAACDERRTTGCVDDPVAGPQCVCAAGFSGHNCQVNSPIRVSALVPAAGTADVRVDSLVIRVTFDHDVQVRRVDPATAVTDTPAVILYQTSKRADVAPRRRCAVTAAAAAQWLSTSGPRASITIPMGVINTAATRFYVVVQPGVFEDKTGQAFAGMTTAGVWNFTTVATLPDALTQEPTVGAHVQLCFAYPYTSVSKASDSTWLQAAVATALNVDSARIGLATFTAYDPSAPAATAVTFTDTTFAQFQIFPVTDPMLYAVEPDPQSLARQLASLAALNASIPTVLSESVRWTLCQSSIVTERVVEPADNTLVETLIIAGVLLFVFLVVLAIALWRTPKTRKVFGPISTLALAWIAAGFDLLLCAQLKDGGSQYNGHFIALVVLLSAGLLLNIVFAFWSLFHRVGKSTGFNAWFSQSDGTNNKVMILLILTAMAFNIDCSELTNSQLFGAVALTAPWSDKDLMRFKVWGLVSVGVQDVPRFVIKILYTVTIGDRTSLTYLSLVVSAVATVWNAFSRIAFVVASRGAIRLRGASAAPGAGAAATAAPANSKSTAGVGAGDAQTRPPRASRQVTPPTRSAIQMSTVRVQSHDSAPALDRPPSTADDLA